MEAVVVVILAILVFEIGMLVGILAERYRKFGQRYWMNECIDDWAEQYAEEWDALARPNAEQTIAVTDYTNMYKRAV
jgi:hypothetical protein